MFLGFPSSPSRSSVAPFASTEAELNIAGSSARPKSPEFPSRRLPFERSPSPRSFSRANNKSPIGNIDPLPLPIATRAPVAFPASRSPFAPSSGQRPLSPDKRRQLDKFLEGGESGFEQREEFQLPKFNQREDFMFASRRKKSNFNPFVEEAPAESQGILTKVVGSIKNTLFPLPRVDEKFEEISFPKRANVGIGNKRHLIFEEAEQQKFDNNSSSRYTEPIDLDIPPRVKRAAADAKVSLPTTKFRSENENFSKTQRTKSSKSPDSSLEFAEVLHRVRSNGKFSPVSQASASPLTRKGFPISPSKSKLDFDSDDFFQVYFEGKMVKDMSRDEVLDGLKWINVTDEMIDDELCYANDDDSELEILKEYLVKKSMQMICENYSFFNL